MALKLTFDRKNKKDKPYIIASLDQFNNCTIELPDGAKTLKASVFSDKKDESKQVVYIEIPD